MVKPIFYTCFESADFKDFHEWDGDEITQEALQTLRDPCAVLVQGRDVHALFFVDEEDHLWRWDCVSGYVREEHRAWSGSILKEFVGQAKSVAYP